MVVCACVSLGGWGYALADHLNYCEKKNKLMFRLYYHVCYYFFVYKC